MSNLKDLMDMGAFIPEELVMKEIKFKFDEDGEETTAVIHIRRLGIGVFEAIWGEEKEGVSKTAKLLSEAIRLGEKGDERMTYAQAYSLHPKIAVAMSTAISEVNGSERKNSPPPSA